MDRARLLQLATIAAISLVAATAEAARVVVLEVRGEDDSEFEEMLVDAIKDEHDVVESRAFDRAARREGVGDDLDARSIARVARSLEAAVVLDSLLARRNGEWELTVRVRAAKDGAVKRKMKVTLVAPRLGNKGKQKVAKELLGMLDEVLAKERKAKRDDVRIERDDDRRGRKADRKRARAADDEEEDGFEDSADDENPLPAGRGKRTRTAALDDEDASLDEELDDEDFRPRRRGKVRRELRRNAFRLEAGMLGIQRRLTFTSRDFEEAPQGYPGSMVPAAHLAIDFFPLAITSPRSVAAGLGVFAEYDRVTSLTTRTSSAPDVALPTRQTRWTVGGKLRYAFGKAPNLPSVTAAFGYGRRSFIVDRSPLPSGSTLDLPDVDYKLYEPSLHFRIPVGTERVALLLGARGLLFKGAGQIQTPESYGAAKLTGLDGEVGLDAAITRNVLLRLHGTYTTIGYDFVGNGAESNGRDGDPETQDVGGASDRWIAAGGSLAIVY